MKSRYRKVEVVQDEISDLRMQKKLEKYTKMFLFSQSISC